ncbi:hypothetical protein PA598K_04960 [Paenibacillus sp. 598K]|uniref:discoidin domain-containing protein n=1 Tax=Paenibacillus sp. 598K TaxID=1117987 RepID=UPI000FFA9E98|nr:discoidin domain-containing protein [Paenibacillus sp. 598K]GBF76486.1 hypothetical protein PA598K_04960 [Paenibacillus sp. 598K]
MLTSGIIGTTRGGGIRPEENTRSSGARQGKRKGGEQGKRQGRRRRLASAALAALLTLALLAGMAPAYPANAAEVEPNGPANADQAPLSGVVKALSIPVAPLGLRSAWRTADTATLVWNEQADRSNLAGYRIYRNGVSIGESDGPPFFVATGLSPGTAYQFTVRAYDDQGSESADSVALRIDTAELERSLWTASASHGSGTASAAIDASATTRWTSGAAQTAGMWFQLDLGAVPLVYDTLVVDASGSSGDYMRSYEVVVSDDGVAWSSPIASGSGSALKTIALGEPRTERYVRLRLASGVGSFWSIHDVRLLGSLEADLTPPTAPTALASSRVSDSEIGLTWTASQDDRALLGYAVYQDGDYSGYTAEPSYVARGLLPDTAYSYTVVAVDRSGKLSTPSAALPTSTAYRLNRTLWQASASAGDASGAIDGNDATRWASGAAQTPGAWFQIDTGPGDKVYSKLTMDATGSAGDYPRRYELRVSDDGASWSEPIATATGNGAITELSFPEQSARFIRIVLVQASGSWWSIHELHLSGRLAPDDVPPSTPANVTASAVRDTELTLSWDAATDNVAVVGYRIYVDGVYNSSVKGLSAAVSGLSPDSDAVLTVRAEDLSGNLSSPSIPLLVRTLPLIRLPLIAGYDMEPDASDPLKLTDTSGLGNSGRLTAPGSLGPGRSGAGSALHLTGPDQARIDQPGLLNKVSSTVTVTAWIKPDHLSGYLPIVSKRDANWKGTTFYVGLDNGRLYFGSDYGENWMRWWYPSSRIRAGEWFHIATVFDKDSGVRFYVDGTLIGEAPASSIPADMLPNDLPLLLGTEWHWDTTTRTMKLYGFQGAIDDLRVYAAPLTAGQVALDRDGALATRPAEETDFTAPTKLSTFRLVRFDTPVGLATKGNASIHRRAERKGGPDAVDWPDITLTVPQPDGTTQELLPFADGSEFKTELWLREQPDNMNLLQRQDDNVFEPGGHWVRGVKWRWGQTFLYTTSRTARSWAWDYELWTFPVRIEGSAVGDVSDVSLRYDGREIYNSGSESYRSLTLLLPQNEPGKPYELRVNGRGPVQFDAGLEPVIAGSPRDEPIVFEQTLPGAGPAVTIRSVDAPDEFPHSQQWGEDVQALSDEIPDAPVYEEAEDSIADYVGLDVPRSPLGINFVYLPHGMSAGGYMHSEHRGTAAPYRDIGTAADYAAYVADTGYDRVFEYGLYGPEGAPPELQAVASELAKRGVSLGLVPMTDWDIINAASPNLAFYSTYLSDFHAPLYREVQLGLQRLGAYPNLAGISLGADNAGYVPYWDWAPPHPNRPWGAAYEAFQRLAGQPLATPLAPSLQGSYTPKAHEYFAADDASFLDYVQRYNRTYDSYGYFARAAGELNPAYMATTGSYGSQPGVGGRGGWPWATIPGKEMHERLPVQTAYDWNELASSKPLHLVSLIDRLRSYDPLKPTWALQDDFGLFFGKADREKAYALTLTRGVQSIGTNTLPNDKGALAQPGIIAEQRELYDWIHRYGGVYAMTEPQPSIGVMYVNEQALLSGVAGGETASEQSLLEGSHEGKATEALFAAHAAGWPAKMITPEELKRGLPSSMKAIVLTGLDEAEGWVWYEGIEQELERFTLHGGIIIADAESAAPPSVDVTSTSMAFRAYVTQSNTDQTRLLLDRNAANIAALRSVMSTVEKPVASSADETVWAVPTMAGDTQYVTVVNQQHNQTPGATQRLLGQTGELAWDTDRPIYDVRLGRKLTAAEAEQVDLTAHGFQWYALPPAEMTLPEAALGIDEEGYYEATATVRNPMPMAGVPLEYSIVHTGASDNAVVYSATGLTARLPLRSDSPAGNYEVTVKELLSGLERVYTVEIAAAPPAGQEQADDATLYDADAIGSFAERVDAPLIMALTEAQQNDPAVYAQAVRLANHYSSAGRDVEWDIAGPNGVVSSLQTYRSQGRYPQWRTKDADLVLFGTASDNVLLLDQARGYLLREHGAGLAAGEGAVQVTYSPFAGEFAVLNVIAADAAGMAAAVDSIVTLPPAKPGQAAGLRLLQITPSTAKLGWEAVSGADGYLLERRASGDATWQVVAELAADAEQFTDTGLQSATFYSYRLSATRSSAVGMSIEARLTTPGQLAPYKLDRSDWTASASHRSGQAQRALDGNPATRWDTGAAQSPGQYFEVDMGALYTVHRIMLDTSASPYDFPKRYELYLSEDGVEWGDPVASGLGKTTTTIVVAQPRAARYLKLVQTDVYGSYWSIYELTVEGTAS